MNSIFRTYPSKGPETVWGCGRIMYDTVDDDDDDGGGGGDGD